LKFLGPQIFALDFIGRLDTILNMANIIHRTAPFDAAEYLDNEETVAEYLSVALEDGDAAMFLKALSNVARARSMTQLAEKAGLGRESLYKMLAPGAKPRFETVMKITQALGVSLSAVASTHSQPSIP
jgi:probable addiction module antidote protein